MFVTSLLFSCKKEKEATVETPFQYEVEQFADIKILRYQIPGFEELTLNQKKLVYFLSQAGMAGRDIMYDQNYKHNLKIRRALESIYQKNEGEKTTADWQNTEIY